MAFPVLVLFAALTARLGAASYFVDFAGGADTNAGTSAEKPWKHCPGDPAGVEAAAACVLAPGDTVFFKGGVTYVFSGLAGIALKWSGEPELPITYDGNSNRGWGSGRANFTDGHGPNAITVFSAAAVRRHLAFKSLEIGPMGGAAELPPDVGSAVVPRFGGGIAFGGGCEGIAITDCVFRGLGYAFNQKPMNAAAIAGTAFSVSGVCREVTFTRCEFSRLAVGLDLARATEILWCEIANSRFGETVLWALNFPAEVASLVDSALILRETTLAEPTFFDVTKWSGHGPDPRAEQVMVNASDTVTLQASCIASPAATFAWRKNGVPIDGATNAVLRLTKVASEDAAAYTAVATNSEGVATSNTATLTVRSQQVPDGAPQPVQASPRPQASGPPAPAAAPPPASLPGPDPLDLPPTSPSPKPVSQMSVRILATDMASSMVTFVVEGSTPRQVLIRVMGPTLAVLGIERSLGDPQLELFRGELLLGRNDDWGGGTEVAAAVARIGTFPFESAKSKDAALLMTLPRGDYQVVAKSADANGGLVMIEVRELP